MVKDTNMNQCDSASSYNVTPRRQSVQMPREPQFAAYKDAIASDEPTRVPTTHDYSPPSLAGTFHVQKPHSTSPHSVTSSFSQDTEDATGRSSFTEQRPLYKPNPDDWIRATQHQRCRSQSAVSGLSTDFGAQATEANAPSSNRQAQNVGKRVKSAFKDMFKRDPEAEKDMTKIETKHWAEDDY